MLQIVRSAMVQIILVVFVFTTSQAGESMTKSRENVSSALEAKYVTVETIRQSLPSVPIIVGFDIDDTVVFSSPGFYFGAKNTDGKDGKSRYGEGDDYLKNPQFWRDLNQFHDRYSMKKKAGEDLIRMHKGRGDYIVFITKRYCYDDDADVLTKRMNSMFGLESKVFCTNEQPKTPKMIETGVDVYYGDSDSDIKEAQTVSPKHVRAIRVQRSPLSTNPRKAGDKVLYNPGSFAEEVLVDSEN